MANDEPQSYGSQADWVTGNTGETVNRQKATPDEQHRDFYDSRRSSESSDDSQGGHLSDVQLAENAQPAGPRSEDEQPVGGVTEQKSGAKRGGFFKDRDYKR